MLNLDTHILIHAFTGDLRGREASLLRSRRWGISGIVLWELAKLAQTGKIEFDLGDPEVVQTLSRVQTWPITVDVARAATGWPLKVAEPVDVVAPPTDDELRVLRDLHERTRRAHSRPVPLPV